MSDGHIHEHGSWQAHIRGLSALFQIKYQDIQEEVLGRRIGLTALVFTHMVRQALVGTNFC